MRTLIFIVAACNAAVWLLIFNAVFDGLSILSFAGIAVSVFLLSALIFGLIHFNPASIAETELPLRARSLDFAHPISLSKTVTDDPSVA